jgi:methionyl-tRNA formyltransferase
MTAAGGSAHGRVVFVGGVHESVPALRALLHSDAEVVTVVTLPTAMQQPPSGRVDLGPLALSAGVPVLRCTDVNEPGVVAHLRGVDPDLVVVVGWTRLLGPDLLAVPPRGCVGFHASLLPRYRGRAPVNWAIIRGEPETGNTMMYLDVGTDTGDIVDQQRVPIAPDDTCAAVYDRVAQVGATMLRRHLPDLLRGTAPRRPQERGRHEVLVKRTPEMGVTDWSRPARSVHDWVRALTVPYPGAFTHRSGRRVMVWATDDPRPGAAGTRPGEVVAVGATGFRVAVGDGTVLVTSASLPGVGPEPAARWARRHGLSVGEAFDAVDPATSRWALGTGPRPEAVRPMAG